GMADLEMRGRAGTIDDLAGDFVSGNARKRRHAPRVGGHDHDGEADTGRAHTQEHVARPDLRHRHVAQLHRGTEPWKDHRFHAFLNRGKSRSALSRSIALRSSAPKPYASSPLTWSSLVRNGKSVPNTTWLTGTSFRREASAIGWAACATS